MCVGDARKDIVWTFSQLEFARFSRSKCVPSYTYSFPLYYTKSRELSFGRAFPMKVPRYFLTFSSFRERARFPARPYLLDGADVATVFIASRRAAPYTPKPNNPLVEARLRVCIYIASRRYYSRCVVRARGRTH